ncbi:protease complex subunit PrcB family protein [soil metagenome]|nr:protease complex subunit PrcB family protein [Trueperaceae bacterium]
MRRLVPLAALTLTLSFVLMACEPDSPPQLHDIVVTGVLDERLTYAYGEPRTFVIEGTEVELGAADPGAPRDDFSIAGALSIDGARVLRSPVEPPSAPVAVRRIPLTTDVTLRTFEETRATLYFDGAAWFVLGQDDPAGIETRVTPRPRTQRLRGLGELTVAEADVVASYLERLDEPLVVSVATEPPRRSIDGLAEYRATAIHVQQGLETDAAAFRPAPRTVQWEVVARGSQALGVERPSYRLLRNEAELRSTWNQAHGAALNVPPLPAVDLSRETLLAVFMGTRPTGGYSVDVREVTLEGGDLFVDLVLVEPGAGAVSTQALTSPWAIVRVLRGGVSAAWFRDPRDGRLYAVARRSD